MLVMLACLTMQASPDIYAPQLVFPADVAENIAVDVNLDWTPVTGLIGLQYVVEISMSEDFEVRETYTTDLSNYKTSLLLFGQQYFWRVKAFDSSGESEWSTVRSFTTLDIVNFTSPNANNPTVAPDVQFKWTSVSGVSHFDMELDTSMNFDSPRFVNYVFAGSLAQANASALHFGEKYYYRMRARHSVDTSGWSVERVLTVVDTIILKNPAMGAIVMPDVEFEWTKVSGVTKYNIKVAIDEDMEFFDSYTVMQPDVTAIKAKVDTMLFGTTYYWTISAIHAKDTLISNQRTFTTVSKVNLMSPSNNATNIPLLPLLKWQPITGITSYQLDLAHNADFTGAFSYKIDSLPSFQIPLHVLDSATVYYWRVRAISSRDTSDFSDTWNFRSVALGLNDVNQVRNGIKVYPSPASTTVDLQFRSTINGKATVEIYDLLGNLRANSNVNVSNGIIKDLSVSNLNNGIYMIQVIQDGNRTVTKLIIKK